VRSRLTPLAVASVGLALAASTASAQLPDPNPPPNPNPTPTPAPAADAKLSAVVASGITDRKHRYVLQGDKLVVRGHIKPFVAGETVDVRLFKGKKQVGHRTVKVRQAKGGTGQFRVSLRIRRSGRYSVRARHDATAKQKAGSSPKAPFRAIAPRAHRGSSGQTVRLLQIGLRRLAYVAPLTGRFEDGTARALLAFRKVNRMAHDSSASRTVFRKLFHGAGGFHLRYPKSGTHVEVDLSRQVLVLAAKGRPVAIYTVSSGKPSTPTIQGTFRFYRKEPGTNSHGMVHSNYFHGGYAIHGYASVPATYPASHGCVRVPIPDALRIYRAISLGELIHVYH
jgi:hypothetical protein